MTQLIADQEALEFVLEQIMDTLTTCITCMEIMSDRMEAVEDLME
jgi:hypothetical protein